MRWGNISDLLFMIPNCSCDRFIGASNLKIQFYYMQTKHVNPSPPNPKILTRPPRGGRFAIFDPIIIILRIGIHEVVLTKFWLQHFEKSKKHPVTAAILVFRCRCLGNRGKIDATASKFVIELHIMAQNDYNDKPAKIYSEKYSFCLI